MIAAVSVVFPWSTCPIVPTFTCGFVRSNFCFATDVAQARRKTHFEIYFVGAVLWKAQNLTNLEIYVVLSEFCVVMMIDCD